jgi:putative PIN family toxin of toxin-antitoxin system
MIILVDTNVLLSAALKDRLPEQVVRFVAVHDEWRWVVTAEILSEYLGVLHRPKFALSTEVVRQWAEVIATRTVLVPSPTIEVTHLRDPKDAPFLSAAIATNADILITGDKDLLQVKPSLPTRIISVAAFVTEFQIA